MAEWDGIVKVKTQTKPQPKQPQNVKIAKKFFRARKRTLPELKFEDQKLTSYAGLVVFQKLFEAVGLDERLGARCSGGDGCGLGVCFKLALIHALVGLKRFRDGELCRDDPMVARTLGSRAVPGVSTMSRTFASASKEDVGDVQSLLSETALERLAGENIKTVTLDFDGTVLSTRRRAEGTAAGFNPGRKGARGYYPLLCTIAQTGQVLDVLHRSGNVHDSNGSLAFIRHCVRLVRARLPRARVELRADCAFFSEATVRELEELDVVFTLSVPFERLAELKNRINERKRWSRLDPSGRTKGFATRWKPESWSRKARFVAVRTHNPRKQSAPVQLDLFQPREYGYDYKVVVTNKKQTMASVVRFHDGRGQQESVIGELKHEGTLAYVPARKWNANKLYMIAGMLAHNLNRELQMRAQPRAPRVPAGRAPMWTFERLATIRANLLARAGRITRPRGKTTLTMSLNQLYQERLIHFLSAI